MSSVQSMHTRRQDQMTENKTVQINPQLIQIFTLVDMVLKKTVINKEKR